ARGTSRQFGPMSGLNWVVMSAPFMSRIGLQFCRNEFAGSSGSWLALSCCEVGDADDLTRRAGRIVSLAPVHGRAVAFEERLVHEQAATLRVRDAGIDRGTVDEAGRRHVAAPLVMDGRTRVGREAREALLVDDPPAERAALCSGVDVVTVRVGERRLFDRPVAPALVHVSVR